MRFAVALCLLLSTPLAAQDRVLVYVFTTAHKSGLTDVHQQQRAASVLTLRKALAKKNTLAVVDTQEAAAFNVEVLASTKMSTGDRTAGFGRWKDEKRYTVSARLSAGEYTMEIEEKRGTGMDDKDAENRVAKAIEKWAKDNRENLRKR